MEKVFLMGRCENSHRKTSTLTAIHSPTLRYTLTRRFTLEESWLWAQEASSTR